jgi:hypothetical protein
MKMQNAKSKEQNVIQNAKRINSFKRHFEFLFACPVELRSPPRFCLQNFDGRSNLFGVILIFDF